VQEDEVEVDINLLPEKEKNKILNQRTRDAERAKAEKKGMSRKVGDHGSQKQWLPPLLHLCCHRLPLHPALSIVT
jgi:hypothetical protein